MGAAKIVRAAASVGPEQTNIFPHPAPFAALGTRRYELIMADPPWPTKLRSPKGEDKSFSRHYGAMTFDAIAALPVAHLAADDCVLFLWFTAPMMWYGGDPEKHYFDHDAAISRVGAVVKAWGFRFASMGFWLKRTKTGKPGFGTGYRLRTCCEPWAIGIKGSPVTSRRERNFFEGLAREHSRKPEAAYAWCERYMPGARRLELFSRTSREGWDSWGDEAGKFDRVVKLGVAA
jgi:N6-adenosine-specific RNA methylase IME4